MSSGAALWFHGARKLRGREELQSYRLITPPPKKKSKHEGGVV